MGVLTSTDATLPVSTWTQAGSGTFANDGTFSFNGSINPAEAQRFYAIAVP